MSEVTNEGMDQTSGAARPAGSGSSVVPEGGPVESSAPLGQETPLGENAAAGQETPLGTGATAGQDARGDAGAPVETRGTTTAAEDASSAEQRGTTTEAPATGSADPSGSAASNPAGPVADATGIDTTRATRESAAGSAGGDASAGAAESGDSRHPRNSGDSGDDGDSGTRAPGGEGLGSEPKVSPEEFAQAHDPAKHDTAEGEEFRQPGDWTADDTGGPQVWGPGGDLVEGEGPGTAAAQATRGEGGEHADSGGQEIRDGGYGIGSAAPMDGGAMPVGHSVKAWEDTKTYVTQEHPSYGDADPHVWFLDAAAAENAGFRPVD